ncbi:MAG TPA: hypothetical protein VGQ90_01305 [Stellaceae bacterium]|nr:hypothetical protein [Stellaceae bacterium]
MNTAPRCDQVLLVQAEFDGELDAAAAAALASHRTNCSVCQAATAELAQARALLGEAPYHWMPDDARSRLMAKIAAATASSAPPRPSSAAPTFLTPAGGGGLGRGRSGEGLGRGQRPSGLRRLWRWWSSLAGFGLGAACAAAISILLLTPRTSDLAEQVVAGHVRALQPGHLQDVVSSDRHAIKPWFDGRIDFAPPVKDLAAKRFPLRGGRLDYIGGRPVAALVYQRDKHWIDLYVWPAASGAVRLRETTAHQGYNVVHWSENGMALWAVSDLEAGQLRQFADDWRKAGD